MNNQQAIKILKEEKSWESDDRKIDAFNMGIEALETLDKIKRVVDEKEYDDMFVPQQLNWDGIVSEMETFLKKLSLLNR